ncbi:MAG: hypothetical protein EPN70_02100 [Paraburkholderia sp.]|uniref:hypothetical protein n=1 Tax=Paraburkholderia sp. TaxID=1926495 RepID=UPI0012272E0F|nr:hypothetical protein [Paraburkholderia sp.]TAM07609.1 MAG: hypothetical protein EPN70_02100 [Paraburkholderia sp.]
MRAETAKPFGWNRGFGYLLIAVVSGIAHVSGAGLNKTEFGCGSGNEQLATSLCTRVAEYRMGFVKNWAEWLVSMEFGVRVGGDLQRICKRTLSCEIRFWVEGNDGDRLTVPRTFRAS